MPIRYREVLEYMKGYLAAYPLGFQADETGQQYIVADRNGYRLGESADPRQIEEMVKSENEAFTNNMQRKTFRELIAMFASWQAPAPSCTMLAGIMLLGVFKRNARARFCPVLAAGLREKLSQI